MIISELLVSLIRFSLIFEKRRKFHASSSDENNVRWEESLLNFEFRLKTVPQVQMYKTLHYHKVDEYAPILKQGFINDSPSWAFYNNILVIFTQNRLNVGIEITGENRFQQLTRTSRKKYTSERNNNRPTKLNGHMSMKSIKE